MLISRQIISLILVITVISCSNDEQNERKILTFNEGQFDQKDFLFNQFYRIFSFNEIENQPLFFGYNENAKKIEVYNTQTGEAIKEISLAKSGPSQIQKLYSFYPHKLDSIFILDLNKISMIDDQGEIVFSIRIHNPNSQIDRIDFSETAFYNTLDNMSPIVYNNLEKSIAVPTKSLAFGRLDDRYYQASLFGFLNLVDLEFSAEEVTYPEQYQSVRYPNDKPNITFLSNKVIYNFPWSSRIFIFDKRTSKKNIIQAPSKFSKNEATPLPLDAIGNQMAMGKNISSNPHYHRIIYDPYQNVYFRFHFSEYSGKQVSGRILRGPMLLTVYDQDFNPLSETVIENHYYNGIPTPKGLLVPYMENQEEGKFKFSYISVK